jgi:hypothetical protein
MTTRQQIAREHNITPGRVSQLAAKGCPVDDLEKARAWIRDKVRRTDNTPVELPPEAAALRLGAKARLERAADAERVHYSLWRAAVQSGTASPRTITELHNAWGDSRKAAAAAEKEYSDFLLRLGTTVNKSEMLASMRAVFGAIKQDLLAQQPWGPAALAIVNRHVSPAGAPFTNNQQPKP